MVPDLREAKQMAQVDRRTVRASLDVLFRSGAAPEPPSGGYAGELVLLDVAPGLTQLARAIVSAWMPWKGKTFRPKESAGDNIFARDSLPLTRLFWPFYRGVVGDTPVTYRAFAFRTYVAPGLFDSDRTVLKINYDIAGNPGPSIRRVLDEIVEISPSILLGKAHLHWWWGRWQTVAYFTLTRR